MHGVNAQALVIMLTCWAMAAVVKACSLWAGYVSHQVADMVIDSLLHDT